MALDRHIGRYSIAYAELTAADTVILPTFVFSRFNSVRIRASTGKAVMAMATPKKRK